MSRMRTKMNNLRPYIGITDFSAFAQVERMQRVLSGLKTDRVLHVGVMMSYKTLHGIPSKWTGVFPSNESLKDIFASSDVYNCLHYADYDGQPGLASCLAAALHYGGPNLHALQLDMPWPSPEHLRTALAASKPVEVILQIGRNALDAVDNDPEKLVARFKQYDGVVHRVLLDKSMGRGLGMDAEGLLPFARALYDAFPHVGLGAAGGLGPDTMNLVEPLVKAFPGLSVDAQGKLRPSGNALHPIDWDMAERYLTSAVKLLC